MPDTDDTTRAMLESLYERFNARDIDAVLERLTSRIDVTVHQVVKDLNGALLSDSTVHHVYRLRGDQIEHMEIRQ
jgi:hypothetical protein